MKKSSGPEVTVSATSVPGGGLSHCIRLSASER